MSVDRFCVQNGIVTGQTSDDIPLPSLEESLLSLEKLDRASPELWPEQSKLNNTRNIILFESSKHVTIFFKSAAICFHFACCHYAHHSS